MFVLYLLGAKLMYDISELMTDAKKEIEGVWRPLPNGAEILVAREGNEEYNKMLRRKYKGSRAILEQEDDLAAKVSEDMLIEVYAHTILRGLRGISINGEPIERYTPEIGIKLLKIKDFRTRVQEYARDSQAYREKGDEAALKN